MNGSYGLFYTHAIKQMAPVATRILAEAYATYYYTYHPIPYFVGSNIKCMVDLIGQGASDDQLLEFINVGCGVEFADLASCMATYFTKTRPDDGAYLGCLVAAGRVDAAEVAAAFNRLPKSAGHALKSLAACILGLVVDSDGTMSVDRENVELPAGESRSRVDQLQALYAAQRAARAGGAPVDPELVAAAYAGNVTLTFGHVTEHGEEVRAWMEARRAKLVESYCAHLAAEEAFIGRGGFHIGCLEEIRSTWSPQSRTALIDRLSSEDNVNCAKFRQARDEFDAANAAYKLAADHYKNVLKKSAASYIATLPSTHIPAEAAPAEVTPAVAPAEAAPAEAAPAVVPPTVDIRGAVAELTKAVAALAKLLGQPAASV
jgi:hypothetical protein